MGKGIKYPEAPRCPWCKKPMTLHIYRRLYGGAWNGYYACDCGAEGPTSPDFKSEELAREEAWNNTVREAELCGPEKEAEL